MIGTWCCVVIGTAATLSAYSSDGDVDRAVCSLVGSSSCLLLPLPFLASCRSAFFTRCGSALPRRGCSCYQLWVRSFGFLSPGSSYAESADFAQVLIGAAAVLFVHHALRDVVMAFHELHGCELFAHVVLRTLLYVLRVVCWTDQHHCSHPPRAAREGVTLGLKCSGFAPTSFSCSGGQPEHEHDRVARVSLRPRVRIPPKLSHFDSWTELCSCAPALLQPLLRWPCASWSVGTSRHRHTCIDRQVTMSGGNLALVINASSARASRSAQPHRGVFAPRSFGIVLSLALENLGLLLDDLFVSPHFQQGPSAPLCHSGLVSLVSSASRIGLRTGFNSFRIACCSQDSSVSQAHISVWTCSTAAG